jgi:hypothetical protein
MKRATCNVKRPTWQLVEVPHDAVKANAAAVLNAAITVDEHAREVRARRAGARPAVSLSLSVFAACAWACACVMSVCLILSRESARTRTLPLCVSVGLRRIPHQIRRVKAVAPIVSLLSPTLSAVCNTEVGPRAPPLQRSIYARNAEVGAPAPPLQRGLRRARIHTASCAVDGASGRTLQVACL